MSKRKTPAQALEEFLSYYDESILEYRYACDKVVEEDKRLQDFLHEMEFAKDRNERNRIATSLQQSRSSLGPLVQSRIKIFYLSVSTSIYTFV